VNKCDGGLLICVSFESVLIDRSTRSLITSILTYRHNQHTYLFRRNRHHKRDNLSIKMKIMLMPFGVNSTQR
jgi:hypothetical protein